MFKFQSKSNTLDFLKKKNFNINNFYSFTKSDIENKKKWINFLIRKFRNKKIILRSSANDEDQLTGSNAGKYDSLVLKKLSEKSLLTSTKKIIKKFKSNNDKVIFQEYLEKPDMSGVIFTRDINNLAPYYVFNYDLSGKTNLIIKKISIIGRLNYSLNSAEMIGSTANSLAISIYEELITDSVWAVQRSNYGYKSVNFNPLMVSFAFSPYIDLRVDLNSFLPKDLPKNIQIKTLNHLINKLKKNPEQHDKIEFNLIPTCNSKDLNTKLSSFLKKSEVEIYSDLLIKLTNKILVKRKMNPFYKDLKDVSLLIKNLDNQKLNKFHPIQNIFYLTQLCKNYGTLPFSGIASTAYVTTSILKDLVSAVIFNEQRLSKFYKNIKSINFDFNNDLNKFYNRKISKISF